jgi:hypothetical protein
VSYWTCEYFNSRRVLNSATFLELIFKPSVSSDLWSKLLKRKPPKTEPTNLGMLSDLRNSFLTVLQTADLVLVSHEEAN